MQPAAEGTRSAATRGRGVELPKSPTPSANYVPFVVMGNLVQVAGVAPKRNSRYAFQGKLGVDFGVGQGYDAARLCGLNALALLQDACDGRLDRIERVVMLRGFVNAEPDFRALPQVIDGASDVLIEVLGERVGRHARTSVGCATLPAGVAAEIDVLVALAPTVHPHGTESSGPAVPRYSWL